MFLSKTKATSVPEHWILLVAVCAFGCVFAAAGCFFAACSFDERSIAVWSGTLSIPEYTGAHMVSETEAVFSFSQDVSAVSVRVASSSSGDFTAEAIDNDGEFSSDVYIALSSPPDIGEKFVLAMTVETSEGNTLSFSETLTGYNSRVPKLRINEARIVYGGSSKNAEFIEFEVTSSGNLSGVVIETYGYTSSKEKNTVYTFPPVEVSKSELVVLHYRLLPEGANFTDETGPNLALSTGDSASDSGRDLWYDAGGKPFSDSCVFLVRERSGGSLMDALIFAKGETSYLSSMQSAAAEAVSAGVWSGSGAFPAFDATGTTATRTICREPGTATASPKSWYVCATSGSSPGKENSSKRYEAK